MPDIDSGFPSPVPSVADTSMIRSEEVLRTSTRTVPIERVRMEKVIVTEEKTITVTVRREELRLTRHMIEPGTPESEVPVEPIQDAAPSMVLSEERVTVTKTVVPVQRVTLVKETVTGELVVTDTIRKERVELDRGSAPASSL